MNNCYMAVHRQTGKYFNGKKKHVGYSKIGNLKSAMTYAKENKNDYYFIKLSFDEKLTPTITQIEE